MKVIMAVTAMVGVAVCNTAANEISGKVKQGIQRDRYLLLDSRVVDSTQNAKLTVGTVQKDKHNPLFAEDKPWESRFDNLYANVIYDEQDKLYKCWYNPFIVDRSSKGMPLEERERKSYRPPGNREMGVCYATSKDGIVWEKPELGIVEFDGSKRNNLVLRRPHGSGVFKDLREANTAKRYKMLTSDVDRKDLAVAFSPDGLHWSRMILCPEINPSNVDGTHYNTLWVPELGRYVGFTRLRSVGARKPVTEPDGKKRRIRQVGRTTSKDFIKWQQAELLMQGLAKHLQIYSMPVFRYAGTYLGLPVIYNTETDRAHTELAWSPDTIEWHRICPGMPLIANSNKRGDYDWGCVYTAAYPVFLEKEIRLYYGASNGPHFGWRDGFFCLATLRPDGFAGYEQIAGDKPASITTVPVVCTGSKLQLCADIQTYGSIKVELFDKDNNELLAESKTIKRTVTDAAVKWQEGFSIDILKGKDIRLRFELKNARLYSFGFDLKSQARINSELSKSVVDSKEDVEKAVRELIEQNKKLEDARREKERIERIRRALPLEEQVPGLIAKLRDENPNVRSTASTQLAKIAKLVKDVAALEPAVAPLIAALADDDMDVRDESTEALGNIAAGIEDKTELKAVVQPLKKAKKDDDEGVRKFVERALRTISDSSSTP